MNTVSVQGLTKRFTLRGRKPEYRSISDWFKLGRSAGAAQRVRSFAALEDVSFEARPGDVIGVIGRNGAGKSTLLKILSRILRPTEGSFVLNGRVSSLLEVGSGFHVELTGRENIYLNGAILGMRRSEIRSKFDEIVAFSGVETYLDEPVKHYSSGMYMRLAFAVAAHIEPEILLLDEVLAVGDAEFQKKCFGKIEEAGRRGLTILFVSHSVQAVNRLCNRALLLEKGRLIQDGPVKEVTASYLHSGLESSGERIYQDLEHAPGDDCVRLRRVRVCSRAGVTQTAVEIGEEFGVEVEFSIFDGSVALFPLITLNNEWGPLFSTVDAGTELHGHPRTPGTYRFTVWVPAHLLSPGTLTVSVAVYSFRTYREHLSDPDAVSFVALETQGGARGHFAGYMAGSVRPLLDWTEERC